MKKLLTLSFLCVLVFGCKEYKDHRGENFEVHHELWKNYCDSFDKYIAIPTPCGDSLQAYYFNLSKVEYKLMYPEGNPASLETPVIKDTICYPIK